MKKREWYVLGYGTGVVAFLLSLLERFYLKPLVEIAQISSLLSTSNLETVTLIAFFITNLISLILFAFTLIFFINGWQQGKAERRDDFWGAEIKMKFTQLLDKTIKKNKNTKI